MITFGAKYITTSNIQRFGRDSKYHDQKVSFIKFLPESTQDKLVINSIASWDVFSSYAKNISDSFNNKVLHKDDYDSEFYALTTQKDKFECIEPESVLGIIQTSKRKKDRYIEYLQTNPEYKFGESMRGFKGIGKVLVQTVLSIIGPNKIVQLDSDESAVGFYKKLGFIEYNDSELNEDDYLMSIKT